MDGDFFIGAALASSLTKMVRKLQVENGPLRKTDKNKLAAESMFIMTSIIRFGLSGNLTLVFFNNKSHSLIANVIPGLPAKPITSDDVDRILVCIRVLAEHNDKVSHIFTNDCRRTLGLMLQEQAEFEALQTKAKKKRDIKVQADDAISFIQLMSRNDMVNGEDVFEVSLSQAVGYNPKKDDTDVIESYHTNFLHQRRGHVIIYLFNDSSSLHRN